MSDDLPRDVEKQLNAGGIFFRDVGRGRFIVEDRRGTPRFLGRNPIWRHDPGSIRNYFPSKQEAYAALNNDTIDLDLAAILR